MDLNNIKAKKVAVYTDSTVSFIFRRCSLVAYSNWDFFSHGIPSLLFPHIFKIIFRLPNFILLRLLLNLWKSTRSTMLSMILAVSNPPIPVSSLLLNLLVNITLMPLLLSVVVPSLIPVRLRVFTVLILKLTFWISSMPLLVRVCLSERSCTP